MSEKISKLLSLTGDDLKEYINTLPEKDVRMMLFSLINKENISRKESINLSLYAR